MGEDDMKVSPTPQSITADYQVAQKKHSEGRFVLLFEKEGKKEVGVYGARWGTIVATFYEVLGWKVTYGKAALTTLGNEAQTQLKTYAERIKVTPDDKTMFSELQKHTMDLGLLNNQELMGFLTSRVAVTTNLSKYDKQLDGEQVSVEDAVNILDYLKEHEAVIKPEYAQQLRDKAQIKLSAAIIKNEPTPESIKDLGKHSLLDAFKIHSELINKAVLYGANRALFEPGLRLYQEGIFDRMRAEINRDIPPIQQAIENATASLQAAQAQQNVLSDRTAYSSIALLDAFPQFRELSDNREVPAEVRDLANDFVLVGEFFQKMIQEGRDLNEDNARHDLSVKLVDHLIDKYGIKDAFDPVRFLDQLSKRLQVNREQLARPSVEYRKNWNSPEALGKKSLQLVGIQKSVDDIDARIKDIDDRMDLQPAMKSVAVEWRLAIREALKKHFGHLKNESDYKKLAKLIDQEETLQTIASHFEALCRGEDTEKMQDIYNDITSRIQSVQEKAYKFIVSKTGTPNLGSNFENLLARLRDQITVTRQFASERIDNKALIEERAKLTGERRDILLLQRDYGQEAARLQNVMSLDSKKTALALAEEIRTLARATKLPQEKGESTEQYFHRLETLQADSFVEGQVKNLPAQAKLDKRRALQSNIRELRAKLFIHKQVQLEQRANSRQALSGYQTQIDHTVNMLKQLPSVADRERVTNEIVTLTATQGKYQEMLDELSKAQASIDSQETVLTHDKLLEISSKIENQGFLFRQGQRAS